MNLYPVILHESIEVVQQQLDLVKDNDDIETVQIDIVDGQYADLITVTPLDLSLLDFGNLTIDLHLMTEEPMDFVWEAIGCKNQLPIRAILAQVERMSFQQDFLEEVTKQEWQPGLSLGTFTPLDAIDEESWALLRAVQLVGVPKPAQGTALHPNLLPKLQELSSKHGKQKNRDDHELEIIVDGGINLTNAPELIKAGATSLVVGSALWKSSDLQQQIEQFKDLV